MSTSPNLACEGLDHAEMRWRDPTKTNTVIASQTSLSFAGLVAFARWSDPIPSRTRPSNASAPMVLCLKTWESRSPPGLPRTEKHPHHETKPKGRVATRALSSVSRTKTPGDRQTQVHAG